MTSEKYFGRTFPSASRRDAGPITDDGIAAPCNSTSAGNLQSVTENMAVPRTPVQSSFKAGVMIPSTTKSAFSSISDILNMKTPEFRPCAPCSKTKEVVNDEMSATGIKKNLYSSLVPDKGCAANATGEGWRDSSSGIRSNSSIQMEYVPPLLRKIRENPSMVKNAPFDLQLLRSSEDDDDDDEHEEDAESNISVTKKNDNHSKVGGRSYLPGSSAESGFSSRGTTKRSVGQRSTGNSGAATMPDKPPTRIPPRCSSRRASHPDKELPANHLRSEDALESHKEDASVRVNGKYYQIFSIIGSGGSSKVYHVFDDKKHEFAVKFVNLEEANEEVTAMFLNEVTILKQLKHCQRVVRLYDYEYCKKKKMLSLVMEKGDTDLSGVLRSIMRANSLSPITVKFYWSEMLYAVKEIHEKGIIHSDLKPANFLFVKGTLKLIDFGIADTMQADVTSVIKSSQMGTLNFMSPESIMGTGEISEKTGRPDIKINTKSDVWSLGCILYALVYGKPPFQDLTSAPQKLHAITNSKHPIPFPEIEDHHLLDVLQQCLQRNPKKRPTISELLQHPYLVEGKSRAASTEPDLASLISSIEQLSPCSFQKVDSFVRTLQKK
ncbi:dual specificity protein kinase Ttk-like [Ornithodoros turicata]|uniref:dual specificity protein kinase Ttk-like n=1 Tax=Ornithodoros turicata TaxID=34597 RepID=UPI003139B342